MDHFQYQGDRLFCENVDLHDIADAVGSPCYIYSHATLTRHANVIDDAWEGIDHLTCYSVKANSNHAVLALLAGHGLGADIVSGGELFRAVRAGFPAGKIVYSGVAKTADEMRYALHEGILAFNVESAAELVELNRVAGEERIVAPVSLRINPDVNPDTHPKISTGLRTAKFGIPHENAQVVYRQAADMEWIRVLGIDAHIGSSLQTVKPFVDAAKRLVDLVESVRSDGVELSMIDIGGGLGITYDAEEPPSPADWSHAVGEVCNGAGLKIITEPGRSVVGNAGILLTRALYRKQNGDKNFVIVDSGMNDLIRPAMYESYHRIVPVLTRENDEITADIVGPICETGDVFAHDRKIETPEQGDLLAVLSAGAYGYTMSSTYNSRPRVAEVMVKDDSWQVVRDRETWDDLVRGERAFTL
jgi:diaminopimelate decarboxylase